MVIIIYFLTFTDKHLFDKFRLVLGEKVEEIDLFEYPERFVETMSHYPERASALDFEDATSPPFGQSDVVFWSIFSSEYQKIPPVIHQH